MASLTPRIDKLESGRNLIINGNFDFAQRGTAFSMGSTAGTFVSDRWKVEAVFGAVINSSRPSSVPTFEESGFKSSVSQRLEVATADATVAATDLFSISQYIEGYNYAELHGRPMRFQIWYRTNVAGTYTVAFRNATGDRSYLSPFTVTSDMLNIWQRLVIDLTADTQGTWNFDNLVGMSVQIVLMAGTNFQSSNINQWNNGGNLLAANTQSNFCATIGNYFEFSQASLIQAKLEPTAFAPFGRAGRNIQDELSMCQRYYERSTFEVSGYAANNTSSMREPIPMKVSKRITPEVTIHSVTEQSNWSAMTIATYSADHIGLAAAADGVGFYRARGVLWSANAEL